MNGASIKHHGTKVFFCSVLVLTGCAQDSVEASGPRPLQDRDGNATTPGGGGGGGAGQTLPDGGGSVSPTPTSSGTSISNPTPFEAGAGENWGAPKDAECNLGGRWLVSQRTVASAIGQTQAAHNWFYYEIRQDGEALTVTRGLHCGYEVKKLSVLGANVRSDSSWAAFLKFNSSTGRKGVFAKDASGCRFELAKEYVARGVTVPFYLDPNNPMPKKEQQANGSTPGWEDWDADGQPGITLSVSGPATGKIFAAQRDWTQYAGSAPINTQKFSAKVTWNNEQIILGRDGSSLLEQSSVPDSDASQHFVWLHRLTAEQAKGGDAELCSAVRTLKDSLVPEANK